MITETNHDKRAFREIPVNSAYLEVPRNLYQRPFSPHRAEKIADSFDERIANEPKVSYRDGHYYVFDGQHTIAARVKNNGGKPLPIKCKVFYGMSETDEAMLFARQTGISARLTQGERMRALICAKDEDALAFKAATEEVGLTLDYAQARGDHRLSCIGTAFKEFRRVGAAVYKEALQSIVDAWNGDPHSLRGEIILGVIGFVELYHDEYSRTRLVNQLERIDPLTIYRQGREANISGSKAERYMLQVYNVYNGTSKKNALPLKF